MTGASKAGLLEDPHAHAGGTAPAAARREVDDRLRAHFDRAQLAEVRNRTLGFVFQSFNLLARTSAAENVELPLLYAGVPTAPAPAAATPASRAGEELVVLSDVTKVYHLGEVDVTPLRGVSLSVRRGEFVAIRGSSGSGKTTLLNLVGCLDRPSSGRYLLDGRDVSRLSRDELAGVRHGSFGFVFQSFNLLGRTSALENVELPLLYGETVPARERHARAKAMLERVGLGDRLDHHPGQLSGGQQQRVAIARALVTRPLLLLADEPTGNLDTRSGQDIMELFHELNAGGLTIILVTHDPEVSVQAGRTIVVQDGLIVEDEG